MLRWLLGREAGRVRLRRSASEAESSFLTLACIPRTFDLAHHRRVDNTMPERGDERHVSPPEPTAWLDVRDAVSERPDRGHVGGSELSVWLHEDLKPVGV